MSDWLQFIRCLFGRHTKDGMSLDGMGAHDLYMCRVCLAPCDENGREVKLYRSA